MWWLLVPLILIGVVVLALAAVSNWVNSNKNSTHEYAEIIKERLATGKFKVVCGIFRRQAGILDYFSNKLDKSNAWEADRIDDDLERTFNGKDVARIEIKS